MSDEPDEEPEDVSEAPVAELGDERAGTEPESLIGDAPVAEAPVGEAPVGGAAAADGEAAPATSGRRTTRQQAEDRRQAKLDMVQEQIDQGGLVVRQMTDEERAKYPPRPPRPGRTGRR